LTLLLMHMSWLGVVVAASAAALCRCLPAAASAARYAIDLTAMIVLLASLPICAMVARDQHVPAQAPRVTATTPDDVVSVVIDDLPRPATTAPSTSPSMNWSNSPLNYGCF
jgi:hypothetical protein